MTQEELTTRGLSITPAQRDTQPQERSVSIEPSEHGYSVKLEDTTVPELVGLALVCATTLTAIYLWRRKQ